MTIHAALDVLQQVAHSLLYPDQLEHFRDLNSKLKKR